MNDGNLSPVVKKDDSMVKEFDWGRLDWYASGPLGNCKTMTIGKCTIFAGFGNEFHSHPNCDEVLHVIKGEIEHALGDKSYTLKTGDTIIIPLGTRHRACAVGVDDAEMIISFSSADRQFVLEE